MPKSHLPPLLCIEKLREIESYFLTKMGGFYDKERELAAETGLSVLDTPTIIFERFPELAIIHQIEDSLSDCVGAFSAAPLFKSAPHDFQSWVDKKIKTYPGNIRSSILMAFEKLDKFADSARLIHSPEKMQLVDTAKDEMKVLLQDFLHLTYMPDFREYFKEQKRSIGENSFGR